MTASAPRWDADAAVEELYASHYRRLVRLSVLLVRDVETAEEVVQDSFVAMHGRWRTLQEPDKGLAYLRQTVVNRSRSVLRHRGVGRHATSRPCVPRDRRRAPTRTRWWPSAAPRCSTPCAALPDRQREVLALRYYLDLSEADIADTLGHQPRRREEPRLPRRGRPALPDGGPVMTPTDDDRIRAPARRRGRRRRAAPRPRRDPVPHRHQAPPRLGLGRRRRGAGHRCDGRAAVLRAPEATATGPARRTPAPPRDHLDRPCAGEGGVLRRGHRRGPAALRGAAPPRLRGGRARRGRGRRRLRPSERPGLPRPRGRPAPRCSGRSSRRACSRWISPARSPTAPAGMTRAAARARRAAARLHRPGTRRRTGRR